MHIPISLIGGPSFFYAQAGQGTLLLDLTHEDQEYITVEEQVN
jgi:hypothetical protein